MLTLASRSALTNVSRTETATANYNVALVGNIRVDYRRALDNNCNGGGSAGGVVRILKLSFASFSGVRTALRRLRSDHTAHNRHVTRGLDALLRVSFSAL